MYRHKIYIIYKYVYSYKYNNAHVSITLSVYG